MADSIMNQLRRVLATHFWFSSSRPLIDGDQLEVRLIDADCSVHGQNNSNSFRLPRKLRQTLRACLPRWDQQKSDKNLLSKNQGQRG